jgi:hypothetical protein
MKDLADKIRKGVPFSEMGYDEDNPEGSNVLSSEQVKLMNWCMGNLRKMLYSLNNNKQSETRLYESNNNIYVDSGNIKLKMSCDGEKFAISGVKLNDSNREKAHMFLYKTIERIVGKVALPVKSVSFVSSLNALDSGELVKSSEEGSVEIVLR